MFRQSAELERFISDFSVDALPLSIRKIVRMLQTAPELKAKELLNELDKVLFVLFLYLCLYVMF